jgi:hypothetical protein
VTSAARPGRRRPVTRSAEYAIYRGASAVPAAPATRRSGASARGTGKGTGCRSRRRPRSTCSAPPSSPSSTHCSRMRPATAGSSGNVSGTAPSEGSGPRRWRWRRRVGPLRRRGGARRSRAWRCTDWDAGPRRSARSTWPSTRWTSSGRGRGAFPRAPSTATDGGSSTRFEPLPCRFGRARPRPALGAGQPAPPGRRERPQDRPFRALDGGDAPRGGSDGVRHLVGPGPGRAPGPARMGDRVGAGDRTPPGGARPGHRAQAPRWPRLPAAGLRARRPRERHIREPRGGARPSEKPVRAPLRARRLADRRAGRGLSARPHVRARRDPRAPRRHDPPHTRRDRPPVVGAG